jgi:hypothetical protein
VADHFRIQARRRVAKDTTVALNGLLYEAPVPLTGQRVILWAHPSTPTKVEVRYQDKTYGFLTQVDPGANYRIRRGADGDRVTTLEPIPAPRRGKLSFGSREARP